MSETTTQQSDTTSVPSTDGDHQPASTSDRVIQISPAALDLVRSIRAEEPEPESLGLRIEITGSKGAEFTYDLAFDELAVAKPDDHLDSADGLTVMVPADSVDRLRGAVLDIPRTEGQGGLVIRNPNRPNPLAGVELKLEGTVAERVQQMLDGHINPSLASHGGFTTLVGVDETNNVYLTMGGGCQGCAMSALTLREGIENSLRAGIPEVNEIIDATDHAAGENPFFT
jgi:Fe/S biogenesis protein NfuA